MKPSVGFETSHKVLVSPLQEKNPIVMLIRNVGISYVDVPCDFHINQEVGCLFLSLKFHLQHKKYIVGRLDKMIGYRQRIVLVHADVEADADLVELTCECMSKNATVLVGFFPQECARYVETLKLYETKSADAIKGEQSHTLEDVWSDSLCTVRSVNSSDVEQLGATFGTMRTLANASQEEMLLCPGLGAKKVARIAEALDAPF